MTAFQPSIIVHGGAGPIKDDSLPARLDGCQAAALAGWEMLRAGGNSLDAAEAAVIVLEDNPLFNAGTGSALNSLGQVEMDAAIMDGAALRAGAVAAVTGIKNPITLARRVLDDGRQYLLPAKAQRCSPAKSDFPMRFRELDRRKRKAALGQQAWHCRLRRFRSEQ